MNNLTGCRLSAGKGGIDDDALPVGRFLRSDPARGPLRTRVRMAIRLSLLLRLERVGRLPNSSRL